MNTLIAEGLVTPQTSQVTLFLHSSKTFKIVPVANAALQELSLLFEAEPTIVAIPSAPEDVPRLMLRQEGTGQLIIGLTRADLILDWKSETRWQGVITSTAEALARALVDKNGLFIHRIGFVLTYTWSEKVNPIDIQKRYFNERIAEASGINLAWHRQTSVVGVTVNRWVRLSHEATSDGRHILEIDQNTTQDNEQDINASQVGEYVSAWQSQIWSELDEIIEW